MRHIKYILGVIVVILLLNQCRPEPLDISLPEYEPTVVVSSQISPGEIMYVSLTRSFTALSYAGAEGDGGYAHLINLLVDSAFVSIEHGGEIDTLDKVSPGIFASSMPLNSVSSNYNLIVTDYNLNKTVTASAEMLSSVKFDTVFPVLTKSIDDTLATIHAEFTDNLLESNFYMINVYSRELLNNGIDVNSFFDNGENKFQSTNIYTEAELKILNYKVEINIEKVNPTDSIAVALSNISEGYYEFLKKRERSSGFLTEVTNEPINYPTNVIGGLGFFNTHIPDVKFFDLKEY